MKDRPLATALLWFAIATAAVVALGQLGGAVPIVAGNLGGLVALVFLVIPFAIADRRGEDMAIYGFTFDPVRRGLALGCGVPLVVFPLFLVGFVVFYDTVCAVDAGAWLAKLAPPGLCRSWRGWSGVHAPRDAWALVELAAIQVVVVAIPEELFFRGFVHELCERALPPRRRLLGGGVGWALVLSSLLFALGHLAIGFDPRRLAVFFPGLLFGWARSATGSILAGVLMHAASNVLVDVLQQMFF